MISFKSSLIDYARSQNNQNIFEQKMEWKEFYLNRTQNSLNIIFFLIIKYHLFLNYRNISAPKTII